jgi:hypothetical protein
MDNQTIGDNFLVGQEMFFFAIAARPTSEPAQPHVL